MKTAAIALLFAHLAIAQIVAGAKAIPFPDSFTASNSLVHITDAPLFPGLQRLEPVFLPTGWNLVQVAGGWFLMNMNPPPAPPLQGLTAWITMSQSALDINTWCIGVPSVGPTLVKYVQPAMLDIWSSVKGLPGTIGAGSVTDAQGFLRIQKNADPSQVNPGVTSALPPFWHEDACGDGMPGVVFPAEWLHDGETRTKVFVLVAF